MKLIFASILFVAACSSNPLDPGAGDSAGGGTNTLSVEGRASAEPNFANASHDTDFSTDFSVRVRLNNVDVTTGTVTLQSRYGMTPLTYNTQENRWQGRAANYDEVYQLDVVSGADKVTGVIVDGPDLHVFTKPMAGATLDSTLANPLAWDRSETADICTFESDGIDRITIADTGNYMMGVGVLKAEKDQARPDTLAITRTNTVTPSGAVSGSTFSVSVRNEIDVIVAPNPNLP